MNARLCCALVVLGVVLTTTCAEETRYVNAAAAPAGDGLSWATAFQNLQDALSAATANDAVSQIWVASGTYTPGPPGAARTVTFQLLNDVALYGGFAGNETELAERDPGVNLTILSGDLAGNDGPNGVNIAENVFQVVAANSVDATAILDGFIIAAGNANGTAPRNAGGGIYIGGGSPTLRRLILRSNRATVGGGLQSLGGSPTIRDCRFEFNVGGDGGGAYFDGGQPSLARCTFVANNAVLGGGFYCASDTPQFHNVAFFANTATFGGGLYASGSNLLVANGVFSGNIASNSGGAVYTQVSGPQLINCTLAGNLCQTGSGGGIFVDGNPVLRNSILWANRDTGGTDESAQVHVALGVPSVNYCIVAGLTGALGGVGNSGLDPRFMDADGADNLVGTNDDDLRLTPISPAVDAGSNPDVPSDAFDLDNDGVTAEPLPRDQRDRSRFIDIIDTLDTGVGPAPIVDLGALEAAPAQPVFVNADAGGGNDGSSWADAYVDLPAAIADAEASGGAVLEIWVAKGTYTPAPPGGDRLASFRIISDLAILGGFDGTEEFRTQRNPQQNVTILSGDLNGDDLPDGGNRNDNSFHVVDASGATNTALLDGFVIVGGHANGGSNADVGAGIFSVEGSATFARCVIRENWANVGAGIYTSNGAPLLLNCTLQSNTADFSGGAVFVDASNPRLVNCLLSGNRSVFGAGGALFNAAGMPTLVNSTIVGNAAEFGSTGGVFTGAGTMTVANCVLTQNSDVSGMGVDAQLRAGGGVLTVNYSCIPGGSFGGSGNLSGDPLLVDPAGLDGLFGTADDDARLGSGSPCIDAGRNSDLPADSVDLDADGNRSEPTPLDHAGAKRFADDPNVVDHGAGTPPIVDIGAFEIPEPRPPLLVNAAAAPGGDGSTWASAINDLQAALTLANEPGSGVSEIWVAAGEYRPDVASGSRSASFRPPAGLRLLGGFAGTETLRGQRDAAANPTILSGDLNGDDGPAFANIAENCYHVVDAAAADGASVLDGFIIRGGNANASPPDDRGGGLRLGSASPTIVDCSFIANSASSGGAVAADQSAARLVNARFLGNRAHFFGGALLINEGALAITNCVFSGNAATGFGFGGAVYHDSGASVLRNCTFAGNFASGGGSGGGLYVATGTPDVANCVFWENTDAGGIDESAQIHLGAGTVLLSYSLVQGLTGALGGAGNIGGDPLFEDADGTDNLIGTLDDNVRVQRGSPAIDAGSNAALPADAGDLDRDGNVGETVPLDLDRRARRIDDPDQPDTGKGSLPLVDLGAYETAAPTPFYVKAGATGAGDGTSWTDAFPTLQSALSVAALPANGVTELWVAQGTYRPANPGGSRAASFELRTGVALFGGFAGNETARAQRDPQAHPTTLSGDLGGNDGADFAGYGENSLHVVRATSVVGAVLDGFVVRGGNANGANPDNLGGGLLCTNADVLVHNCRFDANSASSSGGAARLTGGMLRLVGCTFNGNVASFSGGALSIDGTDLVLLSCTLAGNESMFGAGGALYLINAAPLLANCVFSGNLSAFSTGGAVFSSDASPHIVNCTFAGNLAPIGAGGALFVTKGNPQISNSILWGNQDAGGADESGQVHVSNATPLVRNSCVQGLTGALGGVGNTGANPLFVDANGADQTVGTPDDNLRLALDSPSRDRGDRALLPLDEADLDYDGDAGEALPVDRTGRRRIAGGAVDQGAYEIQRAGSAAGFDSSPDGTPLDFDRCARFMLGDANCDGQVDLFDINAFVVALSNPAQYAQTFPNCDRECVADINQDGSVDAFDIKAFVDLLTGP